MCNRESWIANRFLFYFFCSNKRRSMRESVYENEVPSSNVCCELFFLLLECLVHESSLHILVDLCVLCSLIQKHRQLIWICHNLDLQQLQHTQCTHTEPSRHKYSGWRSVVACWQPKYVIIKNSKCQNA